MSLTKEKKGKILEDLRDKVTRQKVMLLVGITGLKVKDISQLRKKLKPLQGNLKIAKKTLIEKALKDSEIEFDKNNYKEEVALLFGFGDEVLPAKALYQSSLENENFKILGGFLEGNFKTSEEIITLAQLPAKEELLARLVGGISAPVSNFVHALRYNIKGLITVLAKVKT